MGFASLGLLGVAAVVWLSPQLAAAQTAPAAPPPPTPPPATSAPAAAPPTVPPAAMPAPGPAAPAPAADAAAPATAPTPSAPAPAAPAVTAPAAPGPIQLPTLAPAAPVRGNMDVTVAKAEPKRELDPHAAVKGSPFIDATLSGLWLEQRFGDPIVFGIQGGAYLGGAVRLALRLEMPSKNASDDFSFRYEDSSTNTNYYARDSEAATLLYGASLGVVAASSEGFVFAPGVALLRSDVEDYGTMLGIAMPFEWVTRRGLRFGMEFDLGRAFGGSVHYNCRVPGGGPIECATGPTFSGNRGAGRAFVLRFEMGFGFNYPKMQ